MKDILIDFFATLVNLKLQITLPEIPLDMSVCEGSDNEDFEVKYRLMDSDKVKLKDFTPKLETEDASIGCQDILTNAQLQKVTQSGKL